MPRVWSESPTGRSNACAKWGMVRRSIQVHGGVVKGCGKEIQAQIVSHLLELWLPLPWGAGFAIEVIEVATFSESALAYLKELVAANVHCPAWANATHSYFKERIHFLVLVAGRNDSTACPRGVACTSA